MSDRLLIKKIEISNCGGFQNDHIIELSDDKEKNFTIIIGESGRGKSTIFQLIHWCLYGEHFEKRDLNTATDEGVINLPQIDSLEEGAKVTGKITLRINDQDGEKYVLERTITATKVSNDSRSKFDEINNSKIDSGIQTETASKLKLKDKNGNDVWEKNASIIDQEIEKELPESLKHFFLFDGEKLEKFRTKSGSSKLVRDGIEKISGLTLLDSLIKHVGYTKEKISEDIAGKSISSKSLSRTLSDIKEVIADDIKERDRKTTDRNSKEDLVEKIIEQISSTKEGKRIEDLIRLQDKILKTSTKDQGKNDDSIRDYMFDKLPLILISETLQKAEKSFATLEKLNLIPPSITREALDKIFHEKSCVCGTEFQENDAVWKKLLEIKKSVLDKDTTSGITQGRALISQMIDGSNIADIKTKFNDLQRLASGYDRDKLEAGAEKEKLLEELGTTSSSLKGIKHDELKEMRKDYVSDINALSGEIISLEEDIIKNEEKRDIEQKKLDVRLKHEGKYNTELTKISILKAVENYSKKKRKEIIEKLRLQTEKSTGEYFKSSAPQASEFADLPPIGTGPVKISSNYDISAINNQGKEKSLSKGQAHVLGLSYVSGCRQITSKNHFLFIDSPLHNISGDSRNEVAKVLVEHLPNVQIVLFVTDTEYTSGDPEGAKAVREFLNPNTKVGKEWIINVTCIDCKDEILVKSDKTSEELICKNCNKKYIKKIDSTGRRLVTEYERNV